MLGGMLGVGGGVIVGPGLIFIFEWLGIFDDPLLPSNSLVLFAVGTSMASIIFTTGTSALVHYRRKTIDWKLVKIWVPFLVLGAIVASLVAEYIPVQYLKTIVASVIFAIAAVLLLNRLPKVKSTNPPKWIPYTLTTSGGLMCGLVGLGGGNVVVPSLLAYKTPVAQATATASVGALCVSTFASAGYVLAGLDTNVPHSIGYVYLPALVPNRAHEHCVCSTWSNSRSKTIEIGFRTNFWFAYDGRVLEVVFHHTVQLDKFKAVEFVSTRLQHDLTHH